MPHLEEIPVTIVFFPVVMVTIGTQNTMSRQIKAYLRGNPKTKAYLASMCTTCTEHKM